MPVAPAIILIGKERSRLTQEARRRSLPRRIVLRFRIVLRAADGRKNREIAEELRTSAVTVGLWRRRYAMSGFEGIRHDAPRLGGKHRLTPTLVQRIIDTTLHTGLPGGGQWSSRRLAEHLGVSHTTVQRVWRRHHLRANLLRKRRLVMPEGLLRDPVADPPVGDSSERRRARASIRKGPVVTSRK
jgi:Homeodomain-like domain